ncbi:MAG TPA: hypothetical protein VGR66_11615 [Candidatus Eisenbacteria bacterium]|nr:hypothetical protein [Candidatus Eisenbacteria bacterium]
MTNSPQKRTHTLDYVLLIVLYLATRVPFIHTAGFPDGDASQMALGVADAFREGTWFHGVRLYGTAFTTGYYALLFVLSPWHVGDPSRLVPLMNGLGVVSGLAAQLAFYSLLGTLWGRGAALAGSLLLLFTPGWWELNTFGHPTPLAFALFLISLRCFTSRHVTWRACAFFVYTAACLVRADLLLAGFAFPSVAWLQLRNRRSLLLGVAVVAFAALSVAVAVHELVGGRGGAVAAQVGAVFDFQLRTVIKKAAVALLGAGPVIGLAIAAGFLACLFSATYGPLLLAAAVVVPEAMWWLPVEGPFRQWLVAYGMALVPVAVWLGSRKVRSAVVVAIALVVVNQIAAAALYGPIVARYPWTYRAVPGERRWSTRAPIGDWFHHQATAEGAVREEIREAKLIATYPGSSVLIVAPAPYRMEWEVLSRSASYRYTSRADEGALWVDLKSDGRRFVFLEGDPPPTRRALEKAYASGSLDSMPVFVPRGVEPIDSYPIPASVRLTPSSR